MSFEFIELRSIVPNIEEFRAGLVPRWLDARENPRPWKRERKFLWTSWTFGVWSAKIGRKEFRGVDLGPVNWTWSRPVRRG